MIIKILISMMMIIIIIMVLETHRALLHIRNILYRL